MSISPWRLIHLWLAIVSGIFLLVASVTGAVLALEPVYEQAHGFYVPSSDEHSLSELVEVIARCYPGVTSIKRDPNGYIIVSLFDDSGERTFYINPLTGDPIGALIETPEVFDFCRTLHRSLFFGQAGRFMVGLTACLLLVMAMTGFVLTLRKQGGLLAYFKRVIREDFYRDYHTQFGRLFLWVILMISVTGALLFLKRFGVLDDQQQEHEVTPAHLQHVPLPERRAFPVFQSVKLGELEELVYPFSDFEEDFFEVRLTDRVSLVHQYTGEVISTIGYGTIHEVVSFAFNWHTGEGRPWWAILLGISSLSILFFLYSGFAIYARKRAAKKPVRNLYTKEKAEVVLAVGSETGATMSMAVSLHTALLKAGVRAYLVEMSAFSHFPSLKHLIVMTSTYGKGDAPSGATGFERLLKAYDPVCPFSYCVVGFGSRSYPDFCQHAIEVDALLQRRATTTQMLPLAKINNQSKEAFRSWIVGLQGKLKVELHVELPAEEVKKRKLILRKRSFSRNPDDATFLLELGVQKGTLKGYESGDLLMFTPEDGVKRYYSMSVSQDRKSVLLAIKKHEKGLVSTYLSELPEQYPLHVSFEANATFRFPGRAAGVLMLANGTGIAPFLGMLENNMRKVPTTLLWGGQNEASFQLYETRLSQLHEAQKVTHVQVAYSRTDGACTYVQDLLPAYEREVLKLLSDGGMIMICGALNMQKAVEAWLNTLTQCHFNRPIAYYKELGLIKADCY